MADWAGAHLPPTIIPAALGFAHISFCADPDELTELPIIAWMIQPHASKKEVDFVEEHQPSFPNEVPRVTSADTFPITTFGSVMHLDDKWLLKLPDGRYTEFGDDCGNYMDAEAAIAYFKKKR